jgi:hypothetical protein
VRILPTVLIAAFGRSYPRASDILSLLRIHVTCLNVTVCSRLNTYRQRPPARERMFGGLPLENVLRVTDLQTWAISRAFPNTSPRLLRFRQKDKRHMRVRMPITVHEELIPKKAAV